MNIKINHSYIQNASLSNLYFDVSPARWLIEGKARWEGFTEEGGSANMVKAFDERERETIQRALIEKGRELFGLYGLKKTSIKDLTDAVGIAQGSFYLFFPSKEEFYFDIMESEEERMKEQLIGQLMGTGRVTREGFKQFLLTAFRMIDENPIMRRMYMGDDYETLVRKLPPERIEKHQANDTGVLMPLILHWQDEGLMVKKSPDAIGGLMRALFTVTLHKKEIGDVYPQTIELLVELIASGLMKEEEL